VGSENLNKVIPGKLLTLQIIEIPSVYCYEDFLSKDEF